jgi:diguanylate cyclase
VIASPSLVPSLKLARHRFLPDQRASRGQLWLAAELRNAIDRNELRMHYQPILSGRTGEVASIEALIRWEHPTRGCLPPAEFLEALARAELMAEVARWTIVEVARQAAEWRRDLGIAAPIAINVSQRQLSDPAFVPFVRDTLAAWDLSPADVTFELTEEIELGNGDAPLRVLREMRAAGFRVCIDDFGTGYSPLSYLRELPVDAIKIGGALMRDLDGDRRQRSIVRAIIQLAHELDLEVVAEGVESRGQLETLWSLGCDQVQGHFFAHPLAAAPMRAWLSQLR